jgi:hypothetical protein
MNDNTAMNVDDILDMELDDLEDMPEFKPFPAGVHKCSISMAIKEVNDKPCVEVALKAIETLELANPSDEPTKPGDETNVLCFLDNEMGRGNLKAIAAQLAEYAGSRNNRVIIDAVTDVECLVATAIRHNKKTDTDYTDIKEIKVV